MLPDAGGHFGVAITGQVNKVAIIAQAEVVYVLSSAWRFADVGEAAPVCQGIECAGLSGIGSSCEGDLQSRVLGQIPQMVYGDKKSRVLK